MKHLQLDKAVAHQYDNGHYSPLGADGGVLKYIQVAINGTAYRASITLDNDIAQIRRIWELEEVTKEGYKTIYDLTKTYYSLR